MSSLKTIALTVLLGISPSVMAFESDSAPLDQAASAMPARMKQALTLMKEQGMTQICVKVVESEDRERDIEGFTRVCRCLQKGGMKVIRTDLNQPTATIEVLQTNKDSSIYCRLRLRSPEGTLLANFSMDMPRIPPAETDSGAGASEVPVSEM
ncbi:MAG: hypothetical protein R3C49_13450 [Planctomycetaceae bacterium]